MSTLGISQGSVQGAGTDPSKEELLLRPPLVLGWKQEVTSSTATATRKLESGTLKYWCRNLEMQYYCFLAPKFLLF